tara:strand:+ start:320 stop:517 length:198 start_codon:yes stop_codon:yes gene_type:complete
MIEYHKKRFSLDCTILVEIHLYFMLIYSSKKKEDLVVLKIIFFCAKGGRNLAKENLFRFSVLCSL